jgi:hypothetical protein
MASIAEEVEEYLAHFTPSAEQRRQFASSGIAMPDGSYYIRNATELSDAIQSVGRATPNAGESDVARRNAVRRHCIARAKALGLTSMIPDTWNSDGSLKQSLAEKVGDFLEHFGVLGMKWGVRRSDRPGIRGVLERSPTANAQLLGQKISSRRAGTAGHPGRHLGQLKHPVSPEAARAIDLQKRVRKSGTKSLSNQELQDLVTRMNIESQYRNLNQRQVNAGRKIAGDILLNSGKATAQGFIIKYATQGIESLIKKAH